MSGMISNKYRKTQSVLIKLGSEANEKSFIAAFKECYPEDWQRIVDRWRLEEENTPSGKKHSMQHPDIYMHEMWRNQVMNKKTKNKDT